MKSSNMGSKKRKQTTAPKKPEGGSIRAILDHPGVTPHCPHGPTILFKRTSAEGCSTGFFACSAFRDRKECPFYLREGDPVPKTMYESRHPTTTLEDIVGQGKSDFSYCHDCSTLCAGKQAKSAPHKGHRVTTGLSLETLKRPTRIMDTKSCSKKEAQFYFTSKTLETIVKNFKSNNLCRILCIGTPTIHDAILMNHSSDMSSLLLDLDFRLCQFYKRNEFCHYNMFNHHFSEEKNKETYLKFLKDSKPGQLVVVTDPPFGGRPELIANTFRRIQNEYSEIQNHPNCPIEFVWVFPYFMEHQITSAFPEVKMSDYQVSYESGSGYKDGKDGGRKQGSPVRIFTTIDLSKIDLSGESGYKYCDECLMWVSALNRHCPKCKKCSAKNGGSYNHCDKCQRCVKTSWIHCETCARCTLLQHTCKRILNEEDIHSDAPTKKKMKMNARNQR